LFSQAKEKKASHVNNRGNEVKDRSLLDRALKEIITEKLLMPKSDHMLIFLEFSRSKYLETLMTIFPEEILAKSIGIYIRSPFKVCLRRNESRKGKKGSHYVPKKVMKKYYSTDDFTNLAGNIGFPLLVIDNSTDEHERLNEQVRKILPLFKL
jgi:hypothetical protein